MINISNWQLFAEVKVGSKLENIPDLLDEPPIFIKSEMHPGNSSGKEKQLNYTNEHGVGKPDPVRTVKSFGKPLVYKYNLLSCNDA